jgi:hypothetical protein
VWPGNREDAEDVGFGKYNARAPKQVTSLFQVWIDGVEQEPWLINPLKYGDAYLFCPLIRDVLGYDEWQTVVFQKVSETTYSYGGTLVGFLFESTAEVEALPSVLGQKEGFIPPPIYDLQHYNKRRLEFIGDSWMSGFSIRSKVIHIPYDQKLLITRDIGNCQEPGSVLMTDSSLAYPIQVCVRRVLIASLRCRPHVACAICPLSFTVVEMSDEVSVLCNSGPIITVRRRGC